MEFLYKADNLYNQPAERSIVWNDPELAIDWGVENPVIAEKDAKAPLLKDSDADFEYRGEKNVKQQLKRMPVYAAIFLLIFFISQVLFTPGLTESSLRMQLVCSSNDEYQMFYLTEDTAGFTEQASQKQAVVGNPNQQ